MYFLKLEIPSFPMIPNTRSLLKYNQVIYHVRVRAINDILCRKTSFSHHLLCCSFCDLSRRSQMVNSTKNDHGSKKRNLSILFILWFITNLMPWMFINHTGLSNSIKKNILFSLISMRSQTIIKIAHVGLETKKITKMQITQGLSNIFSYKFR